MTTRIRAQFTSTPLPVLLPACVIAGSCLALWPLETATAILIAGALTAVATTSHPFIACIALFILFQDPIQVLAGGNNTLGMAAKRADEPLVIVAGAACLLFNRRVQTALGFRRLGLAILVCFGGLLLSSIPPVGWFPAAVDLALFTKPFLLFSLGLSVTIEPRELRGRLDTVLLTMLACIVFAVVFLIMPQWQDVYAGALRPPDERLGFLSAQGFFLGPGTYGWFAAAAFAIAYGAYLSFRKPQYLAAALTSALFVVLSWRRKSILAVMAMILVSLLVRGIKGSRLRSLAVLVVIMVFAATLLVPYAGGLWQQTVQEYGTADPYGNARWALHYTSLLIARDYFPFGAGLASFASHASKLFYSDTYRQYGLSNMYGLSNLHSEYITDTFWPMVLGEGGLFCLAGYATFFGLLIATTWRAARRREDDPALTFVATTALLLLVGSLIESTASHIYGSSLQAALVLVPAGIAWRAESDRFAQPRRARTTDS